MRFEFATAGRILFGPGVAREIPALAAGFGRRVLVVTGRDAQRAAPLIDALRDQGLAAATFTVPGEPTVALALAGVEQARAAGSDVVIGFGGGSALDAGKAIAALLTNPGDPLDYLEVVGRGQPLEQAPAPYIAAPTTAGTGSEVTRNAVLGVPEQRAKVSLRSPRNLPRVAVVDPELTYSTPRFVTATAGLDALTQLIEPFVSNAANPLVDALCRDGIPRVARSLRRAFENGADAEARAAMALASLYGGLALANARLGAVHGLAMPVGGMFPAPHGAACARLLPLVMDANLRAPGPHRERYAEVARLLTGRPAATAEAGAAWVAELCAALDVPPLARYGVTAADLPEIARRGQKASSMQGNPVKLSDEALVEILEQAL